MCVCFVYAFLKTRTISEKIGSHPLSSGSYYLCLIVFFQNWPNHLLADWNNDPVGVQDALTYLPPDCRSGKQNCTHKTHHFLLCSQCQLMGCENMTLRQDFEFWTVAATNWICSLFPWMNASAGRAHLDRPVETCLQSFSQPLTHLVLRLLTYCLTAQMETWKNHLPHPAHLSTSAATWKQKTRFIRIRPYRHMHFWKLQSAKC